MDLGLGEEQKMLREMARKFLSKECPKTLVRQMEDDPKGYSPDLWKKMAELGWIGMIIPEKYKGTGRSFLDLAVVLEEMGRAIVPGPFIPTVILGAMAIMNAGTEDQKQRFLPKIACGEAIITMALTEPGTTYLPSGVHLKATAEGNCYILNGTKLFVNDAKVSDYMLVAARTKPRTRGEDGVTLFIVDSKDSGIKYTALKTTAGDKQYEVIFRNVRVSKDDILGKLDGGWTVIKDTIQKAAAATSLYMVGGAQQVLEMAAQYAKDRVQFGHPIGFFQAIQHKLANMATEIDGARYVAYHAAWLISEGMPSEKEVSVAKAWTSDTYRRVCADGHQIHGGIGFTMEHDMQLFYRRAQCAAVVFGDADFHRELVAQQIGL